MPKENKNFKRINKDLIRNKRIEKGYSQEKLSDLTGVSRSQIQRLESGETDDTKTSTINKICIVLDIKLEDVINSEDNYE